MDKIDSTLTKISENQHTFCSTEEEAKEYLQVLEQHPKLNISFENPDFPLKFSIKSWERIIQLMDEEKKYSLAFIIFSMINEVEESNIWAIRKNELYEENGDDKMLEASLPPDAPILMCEDDLNVFNQFTDYFNQKEAKNRKLQLSNKKDVQLQDKELDGIQIKEEVNQPFEIEAKILEDKNNSKRENTTKTTSPTLLFQKPIYKIEEETISKPAQEIFNDKAPIKGSKEQKIEISKPSEVTISKIVGLEKPVEEKPKKDIIKSHKKKRRSKKEQKEPENLEEKGSEKPEEKAINVTKAVTKEEKKR